METRHVQRTNDMCYLYLPSKWVKQHCLSNKSLVGISINTDGSLGIYPQAAQQKPTSLTLVARNNTVETIHKLLVAAYISPAESFKIKLGKGIDFTEILTHKNLVSLEVVEIDQDTISCESNVHVNEPLSLLTTMIKKIKNIPIIVSKGDHPELIERYEEEVDRSRLLIEKAVISSLMNPTKSKHTGLELHFISVISKELERMVDHYISLKKPSLEFSKKISDLLTNLQNLMENNSSNLRYEAALSFLDELNFQNVNVVDTATYDQRRIVRAFNNISEILIDWGVIKEIEVNVMPT